METIADVAATTILHPTRHQSDAPAVTRDAATEEPTPIPTTEEPMPPPETLRTWRNPTETTESRETALHPRMARPLADRPCRAGLARSWPTTAVTASSASYLTNDASTCREPLNVPRA